MAFVGLRYAQPSSIPRPRDSSQHQIACLLLNSLLSPFVPAPTDESLYAERALRDGARGYVMKSAGASVILQAIRHILDGHVFLSPIMSQKVFSIFAGKQQHGSPIDNLTDRELEVLEKIGQGQNTRQIAKDLRLSPKTIESHRGNIKMKLNCPDTTSLLRFAVCWVEEN
jgi:DNA-binding NarL/FixJ family response regulator